MKQRILLIIAAAMLLSFSCNKNKIQNNNTQDQNQSFQNQVQKNTEKPRFVFGWQKKQCELLAGEWHESARPYMFLRLKPDCTIEYVDKSKNVILYTGTYSSDGKTVKFDIKGFKKPVTAQLTGNKLTDDQGFFWYRK